MTISRDDVRFWDVRTLERRMRKGQISKKEYEKHVRALPDSANKVAPSEADDDTQRPNGSGTPTL